MHFRSSEGLKKPPKRVKNGGGIIAIYTDPTLENLSRYVIRASFSQERTTYNRAGDSSDAVAKVIYESKNGKTTKTLDALD